MLAQNSIFLSLLLVPALIGICVTILLLKSRKKLIEKNRLNFRSCLFGYLICVAINIFVLIVTMGFLILPCFIITIGPLAIFSYYITKKIIYDTKLPNIILNFIYKLIATLLIWIIAFFPFSSWIITGIISIPVNIVRNYEIAQLQEKISAYETYVDLTKFGLGNYKLKTQGDKHLWDITKPEDYVIDDEGVDLVFEYHINRKNEQDWDNTWGNSNKGKDVIYDVYFYDDTYLIVTPLWDKPGTLYYWGHIYLCKAINKDSDLFDIGILDPKVIENFRELPVERLSRKELSERLGKAF